MKISNYVNQNKLNLSKAEINQLFNNKELNKDKLIRSQLPLVLSVCDSYSKTTPYNVEILFSYALEGVLNALKTYDNKNQSNASFTTYCKNAINFSLKSFLKRNDENIIRQPVRKTDDLPIAYVFSEFEINDEDETKFEDRISDDSESYLDIEDDIIQELYNVLPEHNVDILALHLGFITDKKVSLKEIGVSFNLSPEGVRQNIKSSFKKLKGNTKFKKFLNNLING